MIDFKRLNLIWVLLVTLTLGSFWLSHEAGLTVLSAVAMFAISAYKSELILTNFMEAHHAERQWLWLYRLWVCAVATILIVGFSV